MPRETHKDWDWRATVAEMATQPDAPPPPRPAPALAAPAPAPKALPDRVPIGPHQTVNRAAFERLGLAEWVPPQEAERGENPTGMPA